jgi:hypothetical protein
MKLFAGAFARDRNGAASYPVDTLNHGVYPVTGGMEDWGYAASWANAQAARLGKPPPITRCQPSTYGGYAPEKTVYNEAQVRAFNILVEASDRKKPQGAALGSEDGLLSTGAAGNGHTSRNMRLALVAIDVVQPWLQWTEASGGSHVEDDGRGLGDTERTFALPLREGASQADLLLGWEVGGGMSVGETRVLWGLLPAGGGALAPAERAERLRPEWLEKWRRGRAAAEEGVTWGEVKPDDVLSAPGGVAGGGVGAPTRWSKSTKGRSGHALLWDLAGSDGHTFRDMQAAAYQTAFRASVVLPRGHDPRHAAPRYFVVATAVVDPDWKDHPELRDPPIPPQSHVVNARINKHWSMENNGHRVRGQTTWLSEPLYVTVGDAVGPSGGDGGGGGGGGGDAAVAAAAAAAAATTAAVAAAALEAEKPISQAPVKKEQPFKPAGGSTPKARAPTLPFDLPPPGKTLGGFPDIAEASAFVRATLAKITATLAKLGGGQGSSGPVGAEFPVVFGKTLEGRDMEAICVGARCAAAALAVRTGTELAGGPGGGGPLPAALLTGMVHAREPMSMMALLGFLSFLEQSLAAGSNDVLALLSARQIWLVPELNPDGYAWNKKHPVPGFLLGGGGGQRKNRRGSCRQDPKNSGVDLNRNFAVCWDLNDEDSSPKVCGEDYRGAKPMSEPETQAIASFVSSRGVDISVAVNYHAYGEYINIPYSCQHQQPKMAAADMRVFEALASGMASTSKYQWGQAWCRRDQAYKEAGGKQPASAQKCTAGAGLYPVNGELSDWLFDAKHIYSVSPEVSPHYPYKQGRGEDGFYPKPAARRPGVERLLLANAYAAWMAGPLFEVRHSAVKSFHIPGGASVVMATSALVNTGTRDSAGPVSVAIVDMVDGEAGGDATAAAVAITWAIREDLAGPSFAPFVTTKRPLPPQSRSALTVRATVARGAEFPAFYRLAVWDATMCTLFAFLSKDGRFTLLRRLPAAECRGYGVEGQQTKHLPKAAAAAAPAAASSTTTAASTPAPTAAATADAAAAAMRKAKAVEKLRNMSPAQRARIQQMVPKAATTTSTTSTTPTTGPAAVVRPTDGEDRKGGKEAGDDDGEGDGGGEDGQEAAAERGEGGDGGGEDGEDGEDGDGGDEGGGDGDDESKGSGDSPGGIATGKAAAVAAPPAAAAAVVAAAAGRVPGHHRSSPFAGSGFAAREKGSAHVLAYGVLVCFIAAYARYCAGTDSSGALPRYGRVSARDNEGVEMGRAR